MLRLCSVPKPRSVIETELEAYLCDKYWLPRSDFPLCSDIFGALGLSGDDCHEFMNGIANTFDVDLAEFIWPKYHLGESETLDVSAAMRPLRRFIGLRAQPLDRDLTPISIDHLLHVIELGEWADPESHAAAESPSLGRKFERMHARFRAGGVPRRRSR
jgi:hypothetical protein